MMHSKLGASSYDRYKACPGSIRESVGVENIESEYAKEGSFAHGIAEKLLRGEKIKSGQTSTVTINGVPETREVDDDLLEAVNVYVEYIFSFPTPHYVRYIEKRFSLDKYHPNLFGTSDCIIYDPERKRLIVVDYKHGQGVAVDVVKPYGPNAQLMFYGLGALHELKLPVKEVELVVIQPRCYHQDGPVRSTIVSPIEMLDFSFQLIADAKATEDPNAPLNPGEHCRFCPASFKCPEIKKRSNALIESTFQPLPDLINYDPNDLAHALNQLPVMESYIKAIREFAYREAVSGRVPPGFKLVEKRANRKWTDEKAVVDAVAQNRLFKESDLYTRKIKTVAQVEKLMSKMDFELFRDFIVQESSGQTLVPETDNRKQVLGQSSPFNSLTD